MVRSALHIAVLSAAVALAPAVRADDAGLERARAAYRQGTAAVEAGKLGDAIRFFEVAATLAPHPAAHLAAARTCITTGDKPRAADHLARALALGLDGRDAKTARADLDRLSAELGSVRVTGTRGTARIDEGVVLPAPVLLHAAPGAHKLVLSRDGKEKTIEMIFTRARRETVNLDDELATAAPAERPPPAASTPPEPADQPPADQPAPAAGFPNTLTWVGVTSLVLGGAGGGVCAGLGVAALGARDDFLASRTREDFDHATSLELGTNVSLGVAIGLAVVGTSLLVGSVFIEPDTDEPAASLLRSGVWRF